MSGLVKVPPQELDAYCKNFAKANLVQLVLDAKALSSGKIMSNLPKLAGLIVTIKDSLGIPYGQCMSIADTVIKDAAFDLVLRIAFNQLPKDQDGNFSAIWQEAEKLAGPDTSTRKVEGDSPEPPAHSGASDPGNREPRV